jgi:hypothetical protein
MKLHDTMLRRQQMTAEISALFYFSLELPDRKRKRASQLKP